MSNQIIIALTFISFLIIFAIVGIYSATQKTNTTTDYLLANRQVNPWLTALSAMSTGQSGLLFIGQVGFAYTFGIAGLWLTIGWAIGDYLAWWLAFKRLRLVSEESGSETISSFLENGQKQGRNWIRVTTALIIIAFLGTYAAAQLVAGSKTLNAVFGWNYYVGIILGALVVCIYCFSGGIRASIWTDAIQAVIMIFSLLLLLIVAINYCGGIDQLWATLGKIDPNLVNLNPPDREWGVIPFLLGWIVAGFGVVGQPHIMIRAMAIDSASNLAKARNFKIFCGLINSFAAMGIGLSARVLMPNLLENGDPELALPFLSLDLLPTILVGLMLAGLFAATISTADSQILSCSAALTQDLFPQQAKSYKFAKTGTLIITAITVVIALIENDSVFALVTFSWSALASGLAPLCLLKIWQKNVATPTAIFMMLIGIITALIWNLGLKFSGAMYEVLPGMMAGFLVYFLSQLFSNQKVVKS